MSLIDDIEFYGRAVAASEMDRQTAALALAAASKGGFTPAGAERAIDTWDTARENRRRLASDMVDTVRALENGKPVPEHVRRNARTRSAELLLRRPRRTEDGDQ